MRSFPLSALVSGVSLLGVCGVLSGCSGALVSSAAPETQAVTLTGNWQMRSAAAGAAQLPALSGSISGTSAHATALFHSDAKSACATPDVVAVLSGGTDANGVLTLHGQYAGGTLQISGTPASDGKSLTNATYAVSGGVCGFASAKAMAATAQAVAQVSGTYSGYFTDVYGNQIFVSTVLSQSAADANGNFVLSGYANVPAGNGCFNTPTQTDSAQVTGQNFSINYSDPNTGNTLVTSGSVSVDATTLTVGSWTIQGPCAGENGTGGTLTKQ